MTKIDTNLSAPVPSALPTARRASTGSVAGAAATAGVGATAATKEVAGSPLLGAMRSDAPVDAAKVARLRAAVLDGSYRPDAGRIAERMLDLEKKLP